MSFLWGNTQKKETSIQDQLGFDPATVAPVNTAVLDTEKLHPLGALKSEIEYLDIDGETIARENGAQNGFLPSRGFSDDLCYGSGATYLVGLSFGGAYGFVQGIRNIPPSATSGKLKLNIVLNHITRSGPFLANTFGCCAIMYNVMNYSIGKLRGQFDDVNSIAAGFLGGALYKCTKGVKQMGISSVLMGAVATCWCGAKKWAA